MKNFINQLSTFSLQNVMMYSGDELYALLNNPDNRRLLYVYESSNLYEFANDFEKWSQTFQYFVCWCGLDIVGIAKCKINTNYEEGKVLELLYLEVIPKHQNKGFASQITKKMFDYCKRSNYIFKTAIYSKIGQKKLKPLFNKLSNQMQVPFIDLDITDEIQVNFEYINYHESKRIYHIF